ncbi:MAG: nucleotidyltransferase family protein [Planctomycetota bacterium]
MKTEQKKPTLLILAAGMGSRYGGLKQIDSVGPSGEIIIDYSMYDAVKAGFGKVVFVIRHSFEDAFKEKIGSKLDGIIETAYAYQELQDCLDGFELPADRKKPWGTAQAILVTKDLINKPFAVINADDFYGAGAFKAISDYLSNPERSSNEFCMIGYNLNNTLSEHGSVCRGVCQCDDEMMLQTVVERTKIEKNGDGARYLDDDGVEHFLSGNQIVSMNLWGFDPSVFGFLESGFRDFLAQHGNEMKSEFFIPTAVDDLIQAGKVSVKTLITDEQWFGITYKQDKAAAQACIRQLVDQGIYPERLW